MVTCKLLTAEFQQKCYIDYCTDEKIPEILRHISFLKLLFHKLSTIISRFGMARPACSQIFIPTSAVPLEEPSQVRHQRCLIASVDWLISSSESLSLCLGKQWISLRPNEISGFIRVHQNQNIEVLHCCVLQWQN